MRWPASRVVVCLAAAAGTRTVNFFMVRPTFRRPHILVLTVMLSPNTQNAMIFGRSLSVHRQQQQRVHSE